MAPRTAHPVVLLFAAIFGAGPAACANEVTCDEPADSDGAVAPPADPEPKGDPEPESPGPEDDACVVYGVDCCEIEGCGMGPALGCVGEFRDCYLHRDLCRSDEVCLVERTRGMRGCDDGFGFAEGYIGVCARREEL